MERLSEFLDLYYVFVYVMYCVYDIYIYRILKILYNILRLEEMVIFYNLQIDLFIKILKVLEKILNINLLNNLKNK